ncbi:hypothetical protein MIND_00466900 [Mycena indigotica]|uniref:rRNA biogenesis protein RRP5 n=1 Tax=Mycena indigotica TaxID=2126181 RepID=A0A8H6W6K4_9AGAR|nr:uncharacterized protein MIND_00466900 [Mycena indigotica]KAF7306752.1 hypothetical protein MIND_00466900 [Mycena indigotica]
MPTAVKRPLDDPSSSRKTKKSKTDEAPPKKASGDVDFPRGGGTAFTPLEVKAIRAEAVKEANEELFKPKRPSQKKRKRDTNSEIGPATDKIRIEHLNYKRLTIGMKILGQIVAVQPLALVVSLPNQLLAHVPITNVTSQLTALLEKNMEEEEETEEDDLDSRSPELAEMFKIGQYIRAVVAAVHAPGSTDHTGMGRSRDETTKASRRVELSLLPERVNAGVSKADLTAGFTLSAAVQSVEDHGYIVNLGVADVTGFLSFKDTKSKLAVGQLIGVTVVNTSKNGRTCNISFDENTFSSSCLSEVTNASSVLPGMLVQGLITAVNPNGLNLQILGFFDGTVDRAHLDPNAKEKTYKLGKKVKARVLYDYSTSPPRFALGLTQQAIGLRARQIQRGKEWISLADAYPIGTILTSVKVLHMEPERGVVVDADSGVVQGFAHISHLSDDHIPSLSNSGPWKIGSLHTARVTGYFHFDGLLQLSMKPSVLEQKFLQVADVQVGEVIKGTIKTLNDSGLFVSISGNVDGVVWPNHYADIALKHPAKRFKPGSSIKCRVLVVDPERKRISLTAKKTLVESTLPIVTSMADAKVGTVTHAVVFKVFEKHLMVDFFNNLKAIIPAKELSETPLPNITESFSIGKVLKVRITSSDPEQSRIVASVRQASSDYDISTDMTGIEIGNVVEGTLSEIHSENALLLLQPSRVRALISLNNVANHRKLALTQVRTVLKVGELLTGLVVVTRDVEKSLVIVANKPEPKPKSEPKKAAPVIKASLKLDSLSVGDPVGGRVIRHTRHGSLVKLTPQIMGTLHPIDVADDFEAAVPFPPINTLLKASVVAINATKKEVVLSTRPSRMNPDQVFDITDREVENVTDLCVGQSVRGFVKNIADHGLFVTIGRDIDARVQIKELFDDFVKEWKERFSPNQIVKGRVLSVDTDSGRVEITLRSGDLVKPRTTALGVSDLKVGQKVDGVVTRIEDYGIFISVNKSKVTGLCHKSQLSDNADADVSVAVRSFREGDRVMAVIIGIDKQKVSFSLKPSHFSEEDFQQRDTDSEGEEQEPEEPLDDPSEEEEIASGSNSDQSDDEVIEMPTDTLQSITSGPILPAASKPSALHLTGGFQWSNPQNEDDEQDNSDTDDEEEDSGPKKKKRRKKAIELDLTADMHTKTPESNADYERLLLGSPNSSYLWVQYMSFQLQLSEVDKAREIARRALRTISFREEQEKLNVWIALLNLENAYGTDETLETTFKEAARANDSKTVHLRLASIFEQSQKHANAEEQYQRTCKKFGQSSKVWTLFGEFYLRQGSIEESRKLLPRSLQSLDKRKHLKTISRFAQLEYKLGDPERGKTLFEGIIDSHPKRLDLWSVYMDMEAGQNQIQSLRNLFGRVLSQKLTSHKAKAFFKKWLELEKRIGDEEGIGNVKAKAVEWTLRASSV